MLGNEARKLVLLSLGETLAKGISALHDVGLVESELLVAEVDLWDAVIQFEESFVKILAPLGVVAGGNPFRAQNDLYGSLEMLVVGSEWIVYAKALDPGPIDLQLVDHFDLLSVLGLSNDICFCFSLCFRLCGVLLLFLFFLRFFFLFQFSLELRVVVTASL